MIKLKNKIKKYPCKQNNISKVIACLGLPLAYAGYIYTERMKHKELKRLADSKENEVSYLEPLFVTLEDSTDGEMSFAVCLNLEDEEKEKI
ncbi:hypothetical protein [Peptoniphilus sp.]|uniref:hypothetical protein n=1 Tax=Peptoniphilus sp. TaxID=1971214 RepID=UPI0039942DE0